MIWANRYWWIVWAPCFRYGFLQQGGEGWLVEKSAVQELLSHSAGFLYLCLFFPFSFFWRELTQCSMVWLQEWSLWCLMCVQLKREDCQWVREIFGCDILSIFVLQACDHSALIICFCLWLCCNGSLGLVWIYDIYSTRYFFSQCKYFT